MLDDAEEAAFRESIARVRRLATSRLRAVGDAAGAVAFVVYLHVGVDRVAALAAASGPTPDCRPGCSYCCRARVEVTEPEVFLMVRWVRRQPVGDATALRDRLRCKVAADRAGEAIPRAACAFLVDDRCSAYEVRPAACRKAHSLSVRHCASFSPEIPQSLKLVADAEALMLGTAGAYRDVRLSASPMELNAAVLDALDDPAAEQRWYAGRVAIE